MTAPRSLRPALTCLVAAILLWADAAGAGSAPSPAPARTKPCKGPAVDLDPERFACAAKRQRSAHEVPLPRGVEVRRQDDAGIDLADGVSLGGRLGPREAPAGASRSLDGVATKRTAIVPRDQEPGLGKSLRHGTSDGLGLGLSFEFESR